MFFRLLPLVGSVGFFVGVSFAQPLPDRMPLRGVVVDETGRPVPSAVLILRRQEDTGPTAFWGAEVRADEKGQFAIPNVEVGRYFINVDADGYASLANMAFDWKLGASPARLQLQRLTSLSIQVASPDGKPLVNSPLWLRLRSADGTLRLERVQTNVLGKLLLGNVIPSTYSMAVVASSGIATLTGMAINAQTANVPTEVRLQEGATLRIKTTDVNKTLIGGASLILFPQTPDETTRLGGEGADPGDNWALLSAANAPQALVTHDGDGTLVLKHLPPGRFSGRLSLSGYGTLPRDLTLEEGNTTEWEATFPKRAAATLTLHVRDSSGKAVPNTQIALRLLPLAANGTFAEDPNPIFDPNMSPDTPFASGPNNRVAQTDENGNLTLYPLLLGRLRIFASRPAADSWLRAPVAPEGTPIDITISSTGSNNAEVQVP